MEPPPGKLALVIQGFTRETSDIVSLVLRAPDGGPLRSFTPGSHIDLWLPGGIVRQYALCSSPDDLSNYRIAVQAVQGGRASHFLQSDTCTGQTIEATGPRDTFGFTSASNYLFIAGGVGLAPILPMLHAATASHRAWRLHYFVDDIAQPPFRDKIVQFRDAVVIHHAHESGGRDFTDILRCCASDTRLYCCGPNSLMEDVERAVDGWPRESVRFEWFAKRQAAPTPPRRAVQVRCVRSKLTIDVPPEQSILDTLLAAGLDLPRSCREGTCGTCVVRILDGIPEHRDAVLSDAQRASGRVMMICVSRALSDHLSLDI